MRRQQPTVANRNMTTCPRCGANNEADRFACWDCFAPLQGALAAKVKPAQYRGNGGVTPETAAADAGAAPAKKKGLFGKK
jgi:predicted amidophosphoribosyltransferase